MDSLFRSIRENCTDMKKPFCFVALYLSVAGCVLTARAQELTKMYPLLARLDIPTNSLPTGCSKPDVQPEDFPVEGIRQCAITAHPRAIAALNRQIANVESKSIEAAYFGVYKEGGELFVVGFAFINSEAAKDAYEKANEKTYRAWLHGKYVIALSRDKGATNTCMQQMSAIIDKLVQPSRLPSD